MLSHPVLIGREDDLPVIVREEKWRWWLTGTGSLMNLLCQAVPAPRAPIIVGKKTREFIGLSVSTAHGEILKRLVDCAIDEEVTQSRRQQDDDAK